MTVADLEKQECTCTSCGECHGSGRVSFGDRYCQGCDGSGITEVCDRCQILGEYDDDGL